MSVQQQPVSEWSRRLRAMTGRIDTFFLPLEAVFLSSGERLRELYGTVSRLSSNAEAAGGLFSAAEMDEILAGLKSSAEKLGALHHRRGDLATTLQQIIAESDAVITALNALHRIMSQVRVLAINAKVEASQLVRTGIDFSVFTRDITRLAGSGAVTVDQVRQELNALRDAAVKALTLQREFETRQLPELAGLAQRLAASIHDLEAARTRAAWGAKEIPERLRSLFGAVTNIVSTLQVYDTTRQRLEHVEQALSLAAEMIESGDEDAMSAQQKLVFVNGIAELQSLQLQHASDHYHEAVSDVGRSVATMARGVPEIVDVCQRAFGSNEADSLLAVQHSMEKVEALFGNFMSIRQQATSSLKIATEASARASKLMRSLNSINGDMRLMGLNAVIKCGNMGAIGQSLSVIAKELQNYASMTRDQVQVVASALETISHSAANIVNTEGADEGNLEAEALKHEIDQVVIRLQLTGSGLCQALELIASQSASVLSETRALDEGFSGRAECREAMAEGVRELKAFAADTATGLSGAALEEARREVLAFTESHYTMASERSIHGKAMDGKSVVNLLTGADVDERDMGAQQEPDIEGLLF